MATQVLVRRSVPGRDPEIKVADVLSYSQDGEKLRLKIRGVAEPVEVSKADVLPVGTVAPGQARIGAISRAPEKQFPGRGSLGHLLYP